MARKMNRETTLHIARLARLGLTEDEVELFGGQLGQMLEYVEALRSVDVEGVPPFNELESARVPERVDEVKNPPSEHGELEQAPEVRDRLIVAPSPLADVK
ncbi:MAG: Asp-tRNA(Asn)/Glu-tRNA(Gln) amidotransferase subunit GatC [Candidatus Coatesbacteria bacterium]|nr:Asp-tRNA(Asn)/Glu-tRNA(Gln) amidotransferase subunit GatC [Candidatus Coatesbacteria bacterium]